jgi:hypothetical protein
MAKAELKTKANDGKVEDFVNAVADEQKRADSFRLLKIFQIASFSSVPTRRGTKAAT